MYDVHAPGGKSRRRHAPPLLRRFSLCALCCYQLLNFLLLPVYLSLAQQARRSASRSRGESPARQPNRPSILRPLLAGMIFGAVVLYACGWDSTRGYHITAVHSSSSSDGKAVKNSRGGRLVFDAADGFTAGNSWEGRADREQSNEVLCLRFCRGLTTVYIG